jgi:alkylhydroperoxidase family enzyme
MAWIRIIHEGEAAGPLKAVYDEAVKRAGKVFNILKVMSLSPASLRASMGLYMAAMFHPSPLSRARREMMATVVSAANHCRY